MTMQLLEAERAVLARYLPKLACGLDQLPLEERERCGGGAIELFRRSGGPGLLIPRENKGHGISARDAVRIQRAVGASSPSLAVATTMHHFSVASLLETSRVSQGLEWMLLEAIATCNKIVASGFAEGVRGQSVLRPALCGRRQGGTYILNGTKRPCSLAYSMDLLTASVLLDDDVPGVAVVPAHSKGIRIEPFWSAPVLRGAESDAVVLEDVVVDEAMVVAVGSIDGSAMDSVQAAEFLWFELLMTSSYLGMASALVERTLEESRGSASERSALAGQLEVRRDYYLWKIPTNLAMLAAGWVVFGFLGASWWQLTVAMYLGFCYVQTGLIAHDTGHLQITRTRRGSEALGYFHGNLLMGFSYGWWVNHHNRHHSNPNHLDMDPDILRRRVIFTPEQANQEMSSARRFIIRHQNVLFFPLLLLESLGLRVVSIQILRHRAVRRVAIEAVLIAVHLLIYFTVVFSVLGPLQAVLFILIHQGVFGLYSGAIFAPNHKGLPTRSHEESLDWLTRQVITSRNIRGGLITDFLYGGLNYQIEHHLFPRMPCVNLKKVRPAVRAHCNANDISYCETSIAQSYLEVVRHLRRVSVEAETQGLTRGS